MDGYSALGEAAKRSKRTIVSITEELNIPKNTIYTCAGNGSNPRTDRLSKMLKCCGYKLVAVPKDTPLQDGCFEID